MQILDNLQSNSCSSTVLAENYIYGKFGNVAVGGVPTSSTEPTADSGCTMIYTANTTTASKKIQGKMVVVDLRNNGTLIKSSLTTVNSIYLPKSFS